MKKNYALCLIAFKILLKKDGKFLFLTAFDIGKELLDLPGGRANKNEGKVPIKKILEREIKEEIGSAVKYKIGGPVFQYRRYNPIKDLYNLITVYEGKYISGSIKLSSEHIKYQWIDPTKYKFKEKKFYTKEEYKAFKEYFKITKI